MAHYGRLREYRFSDDVDDIRGATLYGVDDEKLGKIDDVIFDHASGTIQYAVVDSGGWFSSKKFLVPAERIRPYGKNEDDFYADMTKAQIESLPRYEEDHFSSKDDRENERDWSDYNERYRKSLQTDGGVLHREASTHIITPEPSELPATGEALPDESDYEPERVAGVFTDTAPNSSKIRLRPAGLAARAEDSAAPGAFIPSEKPTEVADETLDRDFSRRSPVSTGVTGDAAPLKAPPLSSTPVQAQRDHLTDPEQVYNSEEERHRRLAAFENHLRRNRVDITATCRSCGTKEEKVA
jgi:sporulation protein YlmC with PRC-barrel domain